MTLTYLDMLWEHFYVLRIRILTTVINRSSYVRRLDYERPPIDLYSSLSSYYVFEKFVFTFVAEGEGRWYVNYT